MKILTETQEQLLQQERQFLNDLRIRLADFEVDKEDLETLRQSISQLDDLFLLVIVGEFNAGKSAVINALLGEQWLKEGVTPTTDRINILRYGKNREQRLLETDHEVFFLPVDLLSEVSMVDTPGTNAIIRQHEMLTRHFVPRADLVLFITSVDRPFTESERSFMGQIRDWGKKVVIVLNKVDLLQDEEELEQVKAFVTKNARELLAVAPEVIPVSARLAMRAKNGEPQLWEASCFEPLELFIRNTLDRGSQIRLKFLNPLGVAEHLIGKYASEVAAQQAILDEDIKLLQNVADQQIVFQIDQRKAFDLRMAEIDNIFLEMEQRGDDFFEDRFRLRRVLDLIKKERLQQDFAEEVVAEASLDVEGRVHELIDWLVDSDLHQWQAITDYLANRRHEHKNRIIGDGMTAHYKFDRSRLLEGIGREADRVASTYDKQLEIEKMAFDAQNAVAASLAVELGAVGLGTLITALATSAAADVTGIVAAGVMAALGFFIIPTSRRKAKRDLHDRLSNLRTSLVGSLRLEFEREMANSLKRIEEAILPYSRFVRAAAIRTTEYREVLSEAKLTIEQMRAQIDTWGEDSG